MTLRLRRLASSAVLLASLGFLATFFLAPAVFAQTLDDPTGGLSLALALTAAGAPVVAAFITGIVEILSRTISAIEGHEQGLALILSAVVVVAAIADAVGKGTMVIDLGTIFAGVVAWYGIARVSMGIHDDVLDRNPETSLGQSV
jgi:hypothetical protein